MQETRYDWLADRWVLFAPNRDERPNEYLTPAAHSLSPVGHADCPFCIGAEHSTPEPSLVLPLHELENTRVLRRDEHDRTIRQIQRNWKVRVVPNKYPAVVASSTSLDSSVATNAEEPSRSDLGRIDYPAQERSAGVALLVQPNEVLVESREYFRRETPTGVHEVIIECPDHLTSITSLNVEHIEQILQAYKLRLQHFRSQPNLEYAVVFKNYGCEAGASLSHAHSQLVCLGFIPSDVQRKQSRLLEYFEKHEACYGCQMAHEETRVGERIVLATDHFVVYCPFASRFPFEMIIHPRAHRSHYEDLNGSEQFDLSFVLKQILNALEKAQPGLSYNLVVNTSPFNRFHPLAHHWNMQVIPRASKVAGFELGSECFINTMKPETSAKQLRQFIVSL